MQVYRTAALLGLGEQYEGAATPHAGRLAAQPRCCALLVKRQTYSALIPVRNEPSSEKALLSACRSGDLQNVQQAVQQGASIAAEDKAGAQPIHFACGNGHLPVAQWLVQQGASITVEDKMGKQPIHKACANGPNLSISERAKAIRRAGSTDAKQQPRGSQQRLALVIRPT